MANRDHKPSQPTGKELVVAIERMVEVQEQELEIKGQEIQVQQESIKSNETIALESIKAQKEDRAMQIQAISKDQTQRNFIIGGVITCITAVILVAMATDNTDFAIEFVKIVGGVLIGYIAGVNKGKADSNKE